MPPERVRASEMRSVTTTLKLQRPWFPLSSVPTHSTVVVPIGNRLPAGGVAEPKPAAGRRRA